jgi:flagellar protein FlbT
MGLAIELKAGEKVFIGNSVLTNGEVRVRMLFEGTLPIMRENQYMLPEKAVTPAEKLYLAVQTLYLNGRNPETETAYTLAMRDAIVAQPDQMSLFEQASTLITEKNEFRALRLIRTLFAPKVTPPVRRPAGP